MTDTKRMAKFIEFWTRGLEDDDFKKIIKDIITKNYENCRLTPEEFWEKVEVGHSYNTGFMSIMTIIGVDREANTFTFETNQDDEVTTWPIAYIEMSYDEQHEMKYGRNFPILQVISHVH